jgi:hypothetical protein
LSKQEIKMRNLKKSRIILASSMMLTAAIGTAQAAELCWKLTPFIDTIRVTQLTDDGTTTGTQTASTHRFVFGNWYANAFYNLPVIGAIDTDNSSTSTVIKLRFSVHGTNHTTSFGNHSNCTIDALLGSSWKLSCDGNVTGIYNRSGSSFTSVNCQTLAPAVAVEGPAAGQ